MGPEGFASLKDLHERVDKMIEDHPLNLSGNTAVEKENTASFVVSEAQAGGNPNTSATAAEAPRSAFDNAAKKSGADDLINMSRQILLPAGSRVDEERLSTALRLYVEDSEMAQEISAILAQAMPDREPYLQNLARSALRELLVEETDDLTSTLGLVEQAGVRVPARAQNLGPEDEKLLQEWFEEESQEPNLAEIDFLAEFCGASPEVIALWFSLKRARVRKLSLMKGLSTAGSNLGTEVRLQQHRQNAISNKIEPYCIVPPKSRRAPPPEFDDDDLTVEWYEDEDLDKYWPPRTKPFM